MTRRDLGKKVCVEKLSPWNQSPPHIHCDVLTWSLSWCLPWARAGWQNTLTSCLHGAWSPQGKEGREKLFKKKNPKIQIVLSEMSRVLWKRVAGETQLKCEWSGKDFLRNGYPSWAQRDKAERARPGVGKGPSWHMGLPMKGPEVEKAQCSYKLKETYCSWVW